MIFNSVHCSSEFHEVLGITRPSRGCSDLFPLDVAWLSIIGHWHSGVACGMGSLVDHVDDFGPLVRDDFHSLGSLLVLSYAACNTAFDLLSRL